MKCRFCNKQLKYLFVSLGTSPLANSYLTKEDLLKKEPHYPLNVYICDNCFLVQLPEYENPENIFTDYAYFSSYSDTWLKHSQDYVSKATDLFDINNQSLVIEIGSNDGYLLQYFVEKKIPVLGIDPAVNVVRVANEKGVPTEVAFWGMQTAKRLANQKKYADLLIGNNVLAHTPNLNDFVAGLKIILKPQGVTTIEFPHLMRLMEEVQFDTIYHEHFSYFSFTTAEWVFAKHNLTIFDVEELPTHGGSLRIYAKHKEDNTKGISGRVAQLRQREKEAGYTNINTYLTFADKVKLVKQNVINFLTQAKEKDKIVVGYGAPAKGNTLLNYCKIGTDFIKYTVDRNVHKQGHYLPGSHIPIESPDKINQTTPDYIFILPWNIKEEIIEQMSFIRQWGGRFVIPIPKIMVI